MNGPDRTRRRARGRPGRRSGAKKHLRELLDDDHVGGMLARIRAVGCLIGAAADIDPTQISVAGWLIEALAEEAHARLTAEVQRRFGKRSPSRPRP